MNAVPVAGGDQHAPVVRSRRSPQRQNETSGVVMLVVWAVSDRETLGWALIAVAMTPRPAPDLDRRRDQVVHTAREVAESDGWAAVTMRRLASELGVTQPVLYSVFASRQALIDAVALDGLSDIAAAREAVEASPMARMRAYLDFAAAHPRVYEAMFSMPSGLAFAADQTPEPLRHAFAVVRDAFPDADGTRAEVAWSTLHGLATLQASGRLRVAQAQARLDLAHRMLTQQETH